LRLKQQAAKQARRLSIGLRAQPISFALRGVAMAAAAAAAAAECR